MLDRLDGQPHKNFNKWGYNICTKLKIELKEFFLKMLDRTLTAWLDLGCVWHIELEFVLKATFHTRPRSGIDFLAVKQKLWRKILLDWSGDCSTGWANFFVFEIFWWKSFFGFFSSSFTFNFARITQPTGWNSNLKFVAAVL